MTEQALQRPAQRDAYYDNLRAVLILCVVCGHFLETLRSDCAYANMLYKWIYTFHMPAFLFVSGLFSKSIFKEGKLRTDRLINFFLLYVLFELLVGGFDALVLGKDISFSFFSPRTGLWYLLTLMIYLVLVPLFSRLHPAAVLPLLVLAALMIGKDPEAGNYFSLSRTVTFAPFFWAGYYLDAKKISSFRAKKGVPFVGLGILLVSVVVICLFHNDIPNGWLTGKTSYGKMELSLFAGMGVRLGWYLFAGLMVFALLCVMPKKKTAFSYVGQRTLQVYLLQIFLYLTIGQYHIWSGIPVSSTIQALIALAAAVGTVLLLSAKPVSVPFEGLKKLSVRLSKRLTREV